MGFTDFLSDSALPGLLLTGLGMLAALKGALILYDVYFSSLSAIPGPWYAAASDVWLLLHAARLMQCDTLHALFKQYGPIVRVGPRRVVFCDRGAMKSVYCVHKLHKSSFYKALMADNHDHSMTSVTELEHNMRRRSFASHYSVSHIALFQPDIHLCVNKLIDVLNYTDTPTVDCIHVLRHLLVDILRITVMGLEPRAIDSWAAHIEDPVCAALRDFPIRAILHSLIPSALWRIIVHFPAARWQQFCRSDNTLASFVRARVLDLRQDSRIEPITRDRDRPTPLMLRMLSHSERLSGSTDALSEQDIVSECMAHFVAGVDTSTATFGFMLWELSRRPDVVRRLRVELDDVIPDRRTFPDHTTLAKLPYLSAFLNEGFRMYGAVSSLLERVVPARDELGPRETFDILGFPLPPGTIVGTQAWSMHRDPDVFPSPELFDPERWLVPSGFGGDRDPDAMEQLSRMSQQLMPFGAGTRACPGRYQALIVFRITIAALVLNFDLSADPAETNEATMAPRDAFAVRPAARECKLTFSPRAA